MTKNWFDTHVVVMTLDDDKKKEKAIKAALKKGIKKDAAKFLKSKDGKNYLKLKNKEVA